MSWQATAYVKTLDACPDGARLSRGQKLLAFVLADYHNEHYRVAWPSVPTLAGEALTSHAQAKRDLAYLEEHRLIRKLRPAKMGRGWVSAYEFLALDSEKGAQGDPLFSANKKGSEVAQKGNERGSEVAQKGLREHSAIRKSKELGVEQNKESTPKPPSPPTVVCHFAEIQSAGLTAAAFQDSIELHLQRAGYETQREVPILDRGDGYAGRIDLVARRGDETIVIECDAERPRRKSDIKLQAFPATQCLIVLRDPAPELGEIPSLESQIRVPCHRCRGSGVRASYSTPGRSVSCECLEAN